LLARMLVVPYSVLGQQMVPGQGVVDMACQPDETIAFCDPAGLPFIQRHGPGMAGGASGALYSFLGIRDDDAFPTPVRDAVEAVGLAKYHKYSETLHCIHTVGPNFNMSREDGSRHTIEVRSVLPSPSRRALARTPSLPTDRGLTQAVRPLPLSQEAQTELAHAYRNVLREFVAAAGVEDGPWTLRLLPISGGIFAGPFQSEIAPLTMAAIAEADASLEPATRELLLSDKVLHLVTIYIYICYMLYDI